jgi:hypothetical protein
VPVQELLSGISQLYPSVQVSSAGLDGLLLLGMSIGRIDSVCDSVSLKTPSYDGFGIFGRRCRNSIKMCASRDKTIWNRQDHLVHGVALHSFDLGGCSQMLSR